MKSIAVLAVVVCCAYGAVYRIPFVRNEPQVLKMLRDGTWEDYVKQMAKNRKQNSRPVTGKFSDIYLHPVNNFADTLYVANITLGTPDQLFRVVLVTGSSVFWIPDATCGRPKKPGCEQSECDQGLICHIMCPKQECCAAANDLDDPNADPCEGKTLFNSSISITYRRLKRAWQTRYGTGIAEGFAGVDVLKFGEPALGSYRLTMTDVEFGQASFLDKYNGKETFDGVLGLAFDHYDEGNVQPPMHRAAKQRLIDSPVFTVFLRYSKDADINSGLFTYGGVDNENCGPVIEYQSLTDSYYWQFHIGAVSAGNYTSSKGWDAISDTGTALIGVPDEILSEITKAVGAKFSQQLGLHVVDCQAKPNVTLTIGSHEYTLEAKNLIYQALQGVCIFTMYPASLSDETHWVLGDAFIRQYCHIYDYGRKRIGFAKSLEF